MTMFQATGLVVVGIVFGAAAGYGVAVLIFRQMMAMDLQRQVYPRVIRKMREQLLPNLERLLLLIDCCINARGTPLEYDAADELGKGRDAMRAWIDTWNGGL